MLLGKITWVLAVFSLFCVSVTILQWIGLFHSSLFPWVKRRRNRKNANIYWGAQAIFSLSSISREVRPRREGRKVCPAEILQGQSHKMSSGDSEWIFRVQPCHSVPCRPWAGARATILVLERQWVWLSDGRKMTEKSSEIYSYCPSPYGTPGSQQEQKL